MTALERVAPLSQIGFQLHDFVLYRDAVAFWAGKPDHTFVCQVVHTSHGLFELEDVRGGRKFCRADSRYMRLLPLADCMRDIDVAPLASDDSRLRPAAVAWLEQYAGGAR